MSDKTARTSGLVGPHRESHEPRLDVRNFVRLDGPAQAPSWDATNGLTDWGMDENDAYGDCGAAATDHAMMAQTGSYGQYGQLGMPQFAGTLATYCAYGKAMGEAPNHADCPDDGVDNASWLGFLFSHGIITGYAEVPLSQIDHYGALFKGCILGVVIDGQQAIHDFESHVPWGAMPNARDGHDVLYVATGKVVTWGGLEALGPDFAGMQDAWVILDPDDPNVDGPALRAALAAVHGTIAPAGPTGPTGGAPRPAINAPGLIHDVEADVERVIHPLEQVIEDAVKKEGVNTVLKVLTTIVRDLTHARL